MITQMDFRSRCETSGDHDPSCTICSAVICDESVYRTAQWWHVKTHALAEVAAARVWSQSPALWTIVMRKCVGCFLLELRDTGIPFTVYMFQQILHLLELHNARTKKGMMVAMEKNAFDVCSWIVSDRQAVWRLCNRYNCIQQAADSDNPWFLKLLVTSRVFTDEIGARAVFSDHGLILQLLRQNKIEHFKACMMTDRCNEDQLDMLFSPRMAYHALLGSGDLPDAGIEFYRVLRSKFSLVDICQGRHQSTANKVLRHIHAQEVLFAKHKTCLPAAARASLRHLRLRLTEHIGPDCVNIVYMFTLDIVDAGLLDSVRKRVWECRPLSVLRRSCRC